MYLFELFAARILQSAHGTWDSELGDRGFAIIISLSLFVFSCYFKFKEKHIYERRIAAPSRNS